MSTAALKVIAVTLWMNFFVFLLVSFALGGDAISGRREVGRYFLGYKGHYREVSFALYLFSYTYTLATILGMIGFLAIARRLKTRGRH